MTEGQTLRLVADETKKKHASEPIRTTVVDTPYRGGGIMLDVVEA